MCKICFAAEALAPCDHIFVLFGAAVDGVETWNTLAGVARFQTYGNHRTLFKKKNCYLLSSSPFLP
jgi:hypothetical protein